MKKLLTIIVMIAFAGIYTSYSLSPDGTQAGSKTDCAAIAATDGSSVVKTSGCQDAVVAVKVCDNDQATKTGCQETVAASKTSGCESGVAAVKTSAGVSNTECGKQAAVQTAVAVENACCSSKAKTGTSVAENK